MKNVISISLLFVVFGLVAATMLPPLREVQNNSFHRGEFLKYKVHYGFVNAGNVTVEVIPKTENIKGRSCFHVIGKGFTNSSYDWIYKVRDQYESYIDEKALVPWKFVRNIKEGDFSSYTETHFDHNTGKVMYIDEQFKVTNYTAPINIQDIISAYYYARTTDRNSLNPGDKIPMTNFLDRKVFELYAQFLKREAITIEGKKYQALKMKLLVSEAGMITDDSKIYFWISDDENKIPLRIETELTIGSIKVDLMEYRNLKNPVTSLLK